MVIIQMLEIVFILIYFLLPSEILGMASQVRSGQVREEREGRLCSNYTKLFREKAETSRVKQVQQGHAGTSRDYKRANRGHNCMAAANSAVVLLELDVQWDLARTH